MTRWRRGLDLGWRGCVTSRVTEVQFRAEPQDEELLCREN